MGKPLIAVTGKQGQLGWELMHIVETRFNEFDFLFTDRAQLDLSDSTSISYFFQTHQPTYFINCAAYTAVDKAETEQVIAYQVNAAAVGEIATCCKQYGTTLISISTDYVFNGNGIKPYTTDELTDPVNYYGYTKRVGEQLALANNPKTIIIRTSWVYSAHGNNFVKTMLRLMKDRDTLNVVADQIGSPTYAFDLAETIVQIIQQLALGNQHYGIFHYSNAGVTNWCDFAKAIRDNAGFTCNINGITTAEYPTPAKRPAYSVMDMTTIIEEYGITPRDWKQSLAQCMRLL